MRPTRPPQPDVKPEVPRLGPPPEPRVAPEFAPKPEKKVVKTEPAVKDGGDEPRGLFKRLSGALQKALGTPEKEPEE